MRILEAHLGSTHPDWGAERIAARPLAGWPGDPGDLLARPSPKDVIVKKLDWFRKCGSEKHLRDIGGVLRTSEGLDLDYVEAWVERLGLTEQWRRVRALR